MYLQNKFTQWYYCIINRAKAREIIGYTEKHHIIPKSLGGGNSKDNIVRLTAREHFICHRLLTKMVSDPQHIMKMNNAVWLFQACSPTQERYKITSSVYETIKQNLAESYKSNPNHRTIESRIKQSNTMMGITFEEKYGEEKAKEIKEKLKRKRRKRTPDEVAAMKARLTGIKRLTPSPLKGRKLSEEHKMKCSKALKGRTPWNKGKKLSPHLENLSMSTNIE